MANSYRELLSLLPDAPLQVGTVTSITGGVATITLPGGGQDQARGDAPLNSKVFFCNGVIEGVAPNLPIEVIEV